MLCGDGTGATSYLWQIADREPQIVSHPVNIENRPLPAAHRPLPNEQHPLRAIANGYH